MYSYKLCFVIITLFTLKHGECRRVKRVIGGMEVSCGLQTRVASLKNSTSSQHLCGATLLTRNFAVTAAHCVEYDADNYNLNLNNYCVQDNEMPPQLDVLEVIRHPSYNKYSGTHDIALLRTQFHLQDFTWLSDNLLPESSFGLSGTCSVYGYGVKNLNNEEVSEKLLVANLKLISLDECVSLLDPHVAPKQDGGMLCAIGDGTDACQGDSGGPLICAGKLEGICSYGLSCAVPGIPGVYISIAPHLKWIQNIIHELQYLFVLIEIR